MNQYICKIHQRKLNILRYFSFESSFKLQTVIVSCPKFICITNSSDHRRL